MLLKIVSFANSKGIEMTAQVSLPANQKPHTCALLAHCFGDSEDLPAVREISLALNQTGIAVLRYDYSGEKANLDDVLAAARFMESCYHSPSILIGHSHAGPAVIQAAVQLPAVKAVAAISPSYDPGQLLEALQARRQPLLVMHSPKDETVPFQQGSELFQQAPGPKSFICLDDMDHHLSRKADAHYVGGVIGSWVQRYLNFEKRDALKVEKQVAVRLGETGYTTEVQMRHHSLTADEPEDKGGNDYGPAPYDLVSAALGACTAMTLHMYARRKKWPLKEVTVHLSHFKDYAEDMENVEDKNAKIDYFERLIDVKGELDQTQRERLLEIANKCPVHRTLHNPVKVVSSLK